MRNLSENFTNEELRFISKNIQDIQNNPVYTDVLEEFKEQPILQQRRLMGLLSTAVVADTAIRMLNDPLMRDRAKQEVVSQASKHNHPVEEKLKIYKGDYNLPDDVLSYHTDIEVKHTEHTPIPKRRCNRIEITTSFSNNLSITGIVATLKPLIYYEDGSRRRPAITNTWVLLTDIPVDDVNVLKDFAVEVSQRKNERVERMISEFLRVNRYTEIT